MIECSVLNYKKNLCTTNLFFLSAWFNLSGDSEDAIRRRLQQHNADDSERGDGSDSSCSGSVNGSSQGFRPASRSSPQSHNTSGSTITGANSDYPAPNISVGPPIHPPPHLLPYLYPPGLYPPHDRHAFAPPLSSLFGHQLAAGHQLFNAQLALAAQHPALFSHYSGLAGPGSPLHALKAGHHRFAPYSLHAGGFGVGSSPLGSAFETVTPGEIAKMY